MHPRGLQALAAPALNHRRTAFQGIPVQPEQVAGALDSGAFKAVTLCWNETSTGLTNPIAEIAKVVKDHDAFLIVDGITAVGGLENRMDAWGVDALVMGSQKCLAAPPGLRAGVGGTAFRKELREKRGTVVAGGQGPLKGRIFRIGHMGICHFEDLEAGFQAFEATLAGMGHKAVRGAAVAAIAKRT